LVKYGLALSGGSLAAVLSESTASAVPMPLVWSTAKAASLVAAGQLTAVATPAGFLTLGVLRTMFLAKLKAAVVAVSMAVALGAGSLVYCSGGSAEAQAKPPAKPPTEWEELRKEVELLRLNLRVTLEKIRAQETELDALKEQLQAAKNLNKQSSLPPLGTTIGSRSSSLGGTATRGTTFLGSTGTVVNPTFGSTSFLGGTTATNTTTFGSISTFHPTESKRDPVTEAEAAVKALQAAQSPEEKRKAADALEHALKKLKEQLK
jgi:hypothetical protein